jgi:hypothetical protein
VAKTIHLAAANGGEVLLVSERSVNDTLDVHGILKGRQVSKHCHSQDNTTN